MKKYPYLSDQIFLKEVDEQLVTSQYIKMTLMNWDEHPLQTIEGRITGGSISLNGDSAIRRTCSLNSFVEDDKYDYKSLDAIFSLNKKITIEIGVKNITNKYLEYPIIWFPQGLYVIMGLSLSHSTDGTNISLSLKDKMVLLDGECGGTFPATVTLNQKDDIDEEKNPVLIEVPIYQIIQEVVNHFGGIPISQILINDIDLKIRQVMKWIGDIPLYQYINGDSYEYTLTLKGNEPNKIFSYGDDVGYIYTDFVFPEELIAEAGQSVCDILDKIKNRLGNYEYYFDIWGNFVFQEKKNYLNTRQTTVQLSGLKNEQYLLQMKEGMVAYRFNNSQLITSISNTPKYENIKNDFIVWGTRKTVNGAEYPIRYHLAIDDKPSLRSEPVRLSFYEDEYGLKQAKLDSAGKQIMVTDWRTELYVRGLEADKNMTDAPYYYLELMNEWQKMYDLETHTYKQEYIDKPYELDYYLDFIDTDSTVGQYSISNIGRRSSVMVDNSINCLFEPEIPNVIFISIESIPKEGTLEYANYIEEINTWISRGEKICYVYEDIYSYLGVGGSFNSAFVAIRDLLYQQTNFNESVSITMIPIFHLEPNTRITIIDDQTGTNGDFVITSISIPLDINGTASIQATKALEKI